MKNEKKVSIPLDAPLLQKTTVFLSERRERKFGSGGKEIFHGKEKNLSKEGGVVRDGHP